MMQDFLRKIPLFADLPEADLERICTQANRVHLERGEILFEEGQPGTAAYVIENGALQIFKSRGAREVILADRGEGEVVGEMSLLEDALRMASARALTEIDLIQIQKEQIDVLLRTSLPAASALFRTVLTRWRATEALLRQSEKMAQLGTLTAGVAHELNNPAAAMRRGVSHLGQGIAELQQLETWLMGQALTAPELAEIERVRALAQDRALEPPEFDSLTRSDLEGALEEQLIAFEIDQPWILAPGLVDLGLGTEDLVEMSAAVNREVLPNLLAFAVKAYQVPALLREIDSGAERISILVAALKSYSYLDQAPTQEVDIHQGLKDTLVILRNRFGQRVSIHTDFSEDLPRIHAYGSELNQVWTNLLDNALDAVGEQGEITIRTGVADGWIEVEIEDNGPGIPVEIQDRVFEAFFTTKPPGEGTGLGLDISYSVVVNKHKGDLSFESVPGRTTFKVRLPLKFTSEHSPNADSE